MSIDPKVRAGKYDPREYILLPVLSPSFDIHKHIVNCLMPPLDILKIYFVAWQLHFFIDAQYRKVNRCFPQPSGEINKIQWLGFR